MLQVYGCVEVVSGLAADIPEAGTLLADIDAMLRVFCVFERREEEWLLIEVVAIGVNIGI